ncbi:Cytochrome P450 3A11-like 2 [Homarus americanus]|uniref:Cytochrome P450 3A11-like 2 n=1 Tax=Homarus americanus TaxID=6706 RepID=A0A8J5ML26_HOMAM|nr:Cytochrome P450 3A11-like 2 [Homarus americanus]
MGVEAWLILVVGVLGSWLLLAMGVEVWMLLMVGVLGSWAYTRKRHNYWSARGVSTPPYLPFLGHMHRLFSLTQSKWVYFWEVYRKYGGDKFCGLYEMHTPVLFISDPHLIKLICVKDFEHFVNRRDIGTFRKNSVVNKMLFNKMGSEWKALRSVMTPTFTSGKMRGMFPLICDKADALVSSSLKECAEKSYADMKYNFGSFTIETIASCAFGIDCDSKSDKNINFAKQANNIFAFSLTNLMKHAITRSVPTLSHALGLNKDQPEFLFFESVAEKAIQLRREGQRRGDFLDLLIEARVAEDSFIKNNHSTVNNDHTALTNNHTQAPSKCVLDDDTIIAQSVLFLLAGYDTMASTLTFTSFLLAKNPTHQQRLRRELQDLVQVHGDVTNQVARDGSDYTRW